MTYCDTFTPLVWLIAEDSARDGTCNRLASRSTVRSVSRYNRVSSSKARARASSAASPSPAAANDTTGRAAPSERPFATATMTAIRPNPMTTAPAEISAIASPLRCIAKLSAIAVSASANTTSKTAPASIQPRSAPASPIRAWDKWFAPRDQIQTSAPA